MSESKPNPYAPPRSSYPGNKLNQRDQVLIATVVANTCLVCAAIVLRYIQFRFDDPYENPVAGIATISWIAAIGVGVVGVITVARRLVKKRRVPTMAVIWSMPAGAYLLWFFYNFLKFMMTGL